MDTKQLIARLRDNVDKLNERDQSFAYSLLSALRGLSDKQMYWVEKLGEKATQPKPEPVSINVGNVTAIIDLLERAKEHLKFPSFVMGDRDVALRVSIAGQRAAVPGSITVVGADKDVDGRRPWYGRITRDGGYEPSLKLSANEQTAIAGMLQQFAADPAGEAGRYGRLHGHCCFCNLPLSDERSTEVGYGGTCAEHYGLPWGEKKKAGRKLRLVAA